MLATDPSIREAAVLIKHWAAADIEAVVLLLAEIGSQQQAEDLVVALLMLRDHDIDAIETIIRERT